MSSSLKSESEKTPSVLILVKEGKWCFTVSGEELNCHSSEQSAYLIQQKQMHVLSITKKWFHVCAHNCLMLNYIPIPWQNYKKN